MHYLCTQQLRLWNNYWYNYSEPKFAGWTPAYGLYARHVDGLYVNDVTFRYERPDYRPAVLLDDVKNDVIRHLDSPTEEGVEQVIRK